MGLKRGIYLVANKKSEKLCANLIYSIRQSGCTLPIRLIHFGGKKVESSCILSACEYITVDDFPAEAMDFIKKMQSVISDCPPGFLYRYLGFFSDWDEFIYSDNDIVALCNWEKLFNYLPGNLLVHADLEYQTKGRYNHNKPAEIEQLFGKGALEQAITAGHFVAKNDKKIINDLTLALEWYKQNPGIAKKHDQAVLHIAALLGNWKMVNLCKPPHNWLSSWAGDYKNTLDIILDIQNGKKISHIHYSGFIPRGDRHIEELVFSDVDEKARLSLLTTRGIKVKTGIDFLRHKLWRLKAKLGK